MMLFNSVQGQVSWALPGHCEGPELPWGVHKVWPCASQSPGTLHS